MNLLNSISCDENLLVLSEDYILTRRCDLYQAKVLDNMLLMNQSKIKSYGFVHKQRPKVACSTSQVSFQVCVGHEVISYLSTDTLFCYYIILLPNLGIFTIPFVVLQILLVLGQFSAHILTHADRILRVNIWCLISSFPSFLFSHKLSDFPVRVRKRRSPNSRQKEYAPCSSSTRSSN